MRFGPAKAQKSIVVKTDVPRVLVRAAVRLRGGVDKASLYLVLLEEEILRSVRAGGIPSNQKSAQRIRDPITAWVSCRRYHRNVSTQKDRLRWIWSEKHRHENDVSAFGR